tara:strand:+ start:2617 stop:2817 length:201 start_codon:yes stop_codon:yes gene_type:complete
MIEKRVEQIEQQIEAVTDVLEKVFERIGQLDKLIITLARQNNSPIRPTRYLSDEEAHEMFCTPIEE